MFKIRVTMFPFILNVCFVEIVHDKFYLFYEFLVNNTVLLRWLNSDETILMNNPANYYVEFVNNDSFIETNATIAWLLIL